MNAPAEYLAVQRAGTPDWIRNHTELVRRIAHHLAARLPPGVDVDDLIQAGMIGLIEAGRQYRGDGGASFETFASFRIRGAMIDELRRGDWTPRSVHRKVREAADAMREIEQRHGRAASSQEVAAAVGLKPDKYQQLMDDAARGQVLSLDATVDASGEPALSPDTHQAGPATLFEQDEFRAVLAEAIASLPDRERTVMALYYQEEMNLREIGAVLGVTESRVCQIHGQALVRLRARMGTWKDTGNLPF
ncbi:MAG: RNA polymerase sigma factor FliA [Xanthomonadaceae bacterium]|jgi:RNA polymerase sigma factor for flagellar operon FliA|nr:RNA polymerase sigma factor FliA [Xanthomonadaceae bacterium]